MKKHWTEPCPECGHPADPCVDEHDNPIFNSWGLGYTYYCEECPKHFSDRRRKPKKFLEEKPDSAYEQAVEEY